MSYGVHICQGLECVSILRKSIPWREGSVLPINIYLARKLLLAEPAT